MITISKKTGIKQNTPNSYRQIMKGTSLFGGVQVIIIIIGLIKSKFVAALLGTTGMGISGLYTTTLSLIQVITGLGLSSSAVRVIAEANGSGDDKRISQTILMFRRWVWITGLLGIVITVSLAPILSKWTFGSQEYIWNFIWLSVICFLSAISSGQNVILQGMRRLKLMAKSSLLGSVFGLLISVPLYYLYGLKGIVPSLIIAALCSLLFSWYFSRRIIVQQSKQSWKETFHSGYAMAKLGFVMMFSGLMVALSSYIITLFIGNKGGASDVGLYRAGWTIAIQYTGLVFTAMGTDFYPRLAAVNKENVKLESLVNQQAEMGMLILCPLLVTMICFVPFIIKLFYTSEFMPIAPMIRWSMIGMVFKMASWSVAFVIIAKGDNKTFFITETIGNITILLCNLSGYWFWKIEGIGIAFVIAYLLYCILIIFLTKKLYGICYNRSFIVLFLKAMLFVTCAFIISHFKNDTIWGYIPLMLLVICSIAFFIHEMNKRIEIKGVFSGIMKRE